MEIPPTDEGGWLLEEEELVLQEVSLLGGSQAETQPNNETKEPNCLVTLVAWVFASVFRTKKVDPAASPYEEG